MILSPGKRPEVPEPQSAEREYGPNQFIRLPDGKTKIVGRTPASNAPAGGTDHGR
jgi:hypothetical protein